MDAGSPYDMPDTESHSLYELTHPIYLDVGMMISFLAHLEGGVATTEEETHRETGARERLLKGRAAFGVRLPMVGNTEARGEGSTQRRDESSTETKSERMHTAASLFNGLYDVLVQDRQLASVKSTDDLAQLKVGQLVEFEGTYRGNPLEDVLSFFGTMIPYILEQQEAQRAVIEKAKADARPKRNSGNPAARAKATQAGDEPDALAILDQVAGTIGSADQEFGMKAVVRMAEELATAPVHDILMTTREGLNVVLTVSSEYYDRATHEYLRAGEFKVIGKVTKLMTEGEQIELTRRTVLGAADPAIATNLISDLAKEAKGLETSDPTVEGPCVQVLPMAVYL